MERDGYESDLNRICLYNFKSKTKTYLTTSDNFDSNVDDYCWSADSKTLYFIGVWHGCEMIYKVDLKRNVTQLTDGIFDYGSVQLLNSNGKLLVTRHSMSHPR